MWGELGWPRPTMSWRAEAYNTDIEFRRTQYSIYQSKQSFTAGELGSSLLSWRRYLIHLRNNCLKISMVCSCFESPCIPPRQLHASLSLQLFQEMNHCFSSIAPRSQPCYPDSQNARKHQGLFIYALEQENYLRKDLLPLYPWIDTCTSSTGLFLNSVQSCGRSAQDDERYQILLSRTSSRCVWYPLELSRLSAVSQILICERQELKRCGWAPIQANTSSAQIEILI